MNKLIVGLAAVTMMACTISCRTVSTKTSDAAAVPDAGAQIPITFADDLILDRSQVVPCVYSSELHAMRCMTIEEFRIRTLMAQAEQEAAEQADAGQ